MAEIKTDCFAYTERGGRKVCLALKELYCSIEEECPFYKKKGTLCNGCTNKKGSTECINCLNVIYNIGK